MKITFRYATPDDIRDFYGRIPYTMRAVAVLSEAGCEGLIGLVREKGIWCMFSEYRAGFEPCLKRFTILRAAKFAMRLLEQIREPVFAFAENPTLVQRLGFTPYHGQVYVWNPKAA